MVFDQGEVLQPLEGRIARGTVVHDRVRGLVCQRISAVAVSAPGVPVRVRLATHGGVVKTGAVTSVTQRKPCGSTP
ncbi:MAG: hypothetical protein GY856_45615 [bacterium]|nr:hypothetical protein [bacterium]